MKTISQHLQEALSPVHYRLAEYNGCEQKRDWSHKCQYASGALEQAFGWGRTKEGFGFWRDLSIKLRDGTYKKEPSKMTGTRWLQLLPKHLNLAAIRNVVKQNHGNESKEYSSMANAIASAFTWKDSHEGRQFWSDLYEYLCSNPENPKFPSISDLYAAQLRTSQTTLVPADAPKGEPKQTKKHTTMLSRYASQPVATPTLVFGTDVEDLDENQTVNAIKASQAAIKANAELGVESPRITQLTDGHKAAIAALVSHLDSFATA